MIINNSIASMRFGVTNSCKLAIPPNVNKGIPFYKFNLI